MTDAPRQRSVLPGWAGPSLIVAIVCVLYVGLVLSSAGGNPLAFALIGTRFSTGDAAGSEGYDGQFAYYIARDPLGARDHLDVPAYRYQRILYPLLARGLALGQENAIPWALIAINVGAVVAGTWAVARLLAQCGASRWYALAYGLYGGQIVALRTDLNEPLALALACWGMLFWGRGRRWPAVLCFGLAALSKETALVFAAAYALDALVRRERAAAAMLAASALPFVLLQGGLWYTLGDLGIGSGGANATPFSLLPFGGWLQIAQVKLLAFLVISLIVVPMAVLPAVAGTLLSLKDLVRRQSHPFTVSLLLNSLMIMFLPASTFREPAAMLRFGGGLMVSLLLFGALKRSQRVLKGSLLWIVTNVMLVKGAA